MSYRDRIEEIVNSIRNAACDQRHGVAVTALAHYGPKLIDYGEELDRLHTENERLGAIVDLIALKSERDSLAQQVADLTAKLARAEAGNIY